MSSIGKICSIPVVLCLAVVTVVLAADYQAENKAIACKCRTAEVGKLIVDDFPQTTAWQDAEWETWRDGHTGLVDADRIGNATKTYNCHSFCYNGSDRWLNVGAAGLEKFYDGTGSKCWKADSNGTVLTLKTGANHSCLVDENTGKCGNSFLQKHNQYVYPTMPTDKYIQNP